MLLLNNEIKFMIKRNCSAMFVGVKQHNLVSSSE